MPPAADQPRTLADRVALIGLVLGPVLAVLAYAMLPGAGVDESTGLATGLSEPGRATAATGVLMAVWWLTEAIPISATALLPLVLLPLTGATGVKDAAAPYANEVIYLFMGGFMLGLAMEKWGLHKRIALTTLLIIGTSPRRIIAGFMIASAMLSAWVSNTATAVMMLPIALSVIALIAAQHAPPGVPCEDAPSPDPHFDSTLLLGVAYACSIGGVTTLIGTPPNAILRGYVESELGREIGFANWLILGGAIAFVMLPMVWFYLVFISQPISLRTIPGGRNLFRGELRALGKPSRGELTVLIVFCCTVLLWLTRPLLVSLGASRGIAPLAGLNDSSIAIGAALVLFCLPVDLKRRSFAMDWHTTQRLPWGVLVLFGGGLSLAAAISANGVDSFIGSGFVRLDALPVWLVVALVCTLVIFLTELTSNTAVTTALLPVLGAAAVALGIDPLKLVVPAAIVASLAFMLPVATPPNAIVFGSGRITVAQMARAGFVLNIIGVVVVTVGTILLGDFIVDLGGAP
ncbi:MAG: SLC13 family permease [Phycisphaerales bacterium JB041]